MAVEGSPFAGPDTLPWAEAATRGVLLIKQCLACGEHHYYPRPFCPFCFSERTEYREASGEATIYSYSITRAAEPYVIAYVTLAEGPTLMTNIVDTPLEAIRIGLPVTLEFRDGPLGFPAPMFRAGVQPGS
jgi:uncharacterized OB-fold protein